MSVRVVIRNLNTFRGFYLKKGFNVIRRYLQGDEKDDKKDCFEYVGCKKTQKAAKKLLKETENSSKDDPHKLEIVEYKTIKEEE